MLATRVSLGRHNPILVSTEPHPHLHPFTEMSPRRDGPSGTLLSPDAPVLPEGAPCLRLDGA
jgi:hypothetical protein